MDTSIKRMQTPEKYLKWSFLLLPTCIKWTLVIKFHHPTCQTPEMRKIASNCRPQIFSIFTLKSVTWRTYLISFTVQYCFLFRFVCIELVSLIWFLKIWVAIYVYGNLIKCFHCSFEWHLTLHMTLSIETCFWWTPCIKWTLQHSPSVSA